MSKSHSMCSLDLLWGLGGKSGQCKRFRCVEILQSSPKCHWNGSSSDTAIKSFNEFSATWAKAQEREQKIGQQGERTLFTVWLFLLLVNVERESGTHTRLFYSWPKRLFCPVVASLVRNIGIFRASSLACSPIARQFTVCLFSVH